MIRIFIVVNIIGLDGEAMDSKKTLNNGASTRQTIGSLMSEHDRSSSVIGLFIDDVDMDANDNEQLIKN